MAMLKIGSNEIAIHKYCQRDCAFCKKCDSLLCKSASPIPENGGKIFGCSQEFPKKYSNIFDEYVRAMTKVAKAQDRYGKIGIYDPEFHYYRVIGLHADVPNDNGDLFKWGNSNDYNEPELLRYDNGLGKFVYQTFIGRGNFKNHQNDDVSKAVGIILDAIPNHNGRLIENLIAVDENKDAELIRAIDKGYINSVSMGCRVAFSLCSVCGNKARTENEYCDHIKFNKGHDIWHEGAFKKVYEDNRGVNFIELSWVTVPADRNAKLLEKIASDLNAEAFDVVTMLVDIYGESQTKKILNAIKKFES